MRRLMAVAAVAVLGILAVPVVAFAFDWDAGGTRTFGQWRDKDRWVGGDRGGAAAAPGSTGTTARMPMGAWADGPGDWCDDWDHRWSRGQTTPAPPTTTTTTPPEGAPRRVTVSASEFGFSPEEIRVAAGEPVLLTLRNDGRVAHDLVLSDLGVRLVASPGETASRDLGALPPGEYVFECSVPGHAGAGMVGRLVVS